MEIFLEVPSEQAHLRDDKGQITSASLAASWMFGVVHEVAQQCFALKLIIRQRIDEVLTLS